MNTAGDSRAAAVFRAAFGGEPEVMASAPGRVNLLGEHTDYNGGFVLPIAIGQRTTIAMRRSRTPGFVLHSSEHACTTRFSLGNMPAEHFASYVYGCLSEAAEAGIDVPFLQIAISSEVPIGVGLSSSAALEVATLRALRALTGAAIDDVQIAQMAQRAENRYAGVQCGLMDQLASSLAGTEQALWFDTLTLERALVPLPHASEVLVLDSGISRSLAQSGYNTRRSECDEAARRLGVASLRELSTDAVIGALPPNLLKRVRHVLTENARVMRAVQTTDALAFGALMNESHASLRDDYEVSVPDLDALVDLLQRHPQVRGARLTGAGFGGACVALCSIGQSTAVATDVLARYANASRAGALLVPQPPLAGYGTDS